MFYLRLLTFFKIKVFFLQINHSGSLSECQTVWIQIKTDVLLVFIWVQTVCKRLLADDKILHWHAKASDIEAAFLDLHLSISNDIVSTKIYDKRDDFDFEIFNFPYLDGDVPRSTSYRVFISQLIRFARASSYVADFKTRKNC